MPSFQPPLAASQPFQYPASPGWIPGSGWIAEFNPRASSPHEVEARRLIEELAWIGEQIAGVVGESCEQAFVLGGRAGDGGFALDAGVARGIDEGDAEAANLVD